MTIHGISHLTFIVRDLVRASTFFCEGLGAEPVYDSGARTFSRSPEKFFLLGGVWIAAMEGTPPSERSYRHAAFEAGPLDLPIYADRLSRIGAELLPPRPRVEGEGESLYFYDFDNHLFELHAGSLAQRLARYQLQPT
jgi:fosfomycin resistance protein FosX